MSTDLTDCDITERLAKLVGVKLEFIDGHRGYTANCREFRPLDCLDDARLCEEKLREMGLGREYSTHLFGKVLGDDGDKSLDEFGGIEYDRGLIAYATARQKCLAMLATLGLATLQVTSRDGLSLTAKPMAVIESSMHHVDADDYSDYTELEGTLDVVSVHNGPRKVIVYDPLTRAKVECRVNRQELWDKALDIMKRDNRRVSIYGLAHYKKDFPSWVQVEDLESLPGRNELPDPLRMEGIDLTGGVDSVDYIRGLRDAE